MINSLSWFQYTGVRSSKRLLCPTPFVQSDNLYVFYGEQTALGKPANLRCVMGKPGENMTGIPIEYDDESEHDVSLGNLPNYVYAEYENEIILICAEFRFATRHKHQLIAHKHKIEILNEKIRIFPRENFPFFNYQSEEFHTLAGMSFFKGKYLVAEGEEWFESGSGLTPVTSMKTYVSGQHEKASLPFSKESAEIAHARPVMCEYKGLEFFAYSVRYLNQAYGSKIFYKINESFASVQQTFWIENRPYTEMELAYLFPFRWSNELWCIATRDFRGTLGFELFKGVIND